MSSSLRFTPCFTLALFATAPSASADLIDWAAPQDTTSTAEIRTNGASVGAFNFWNSTTSVDLTLNGVTFIAPFTPNQWDSGGGSLMAVATTGDADFDQLLALE